MSPPFCRRTPDRIDLPSTPVPQSNGVWRFHHVYRAGETIPAGLHPGIPHPLSVVSGAIEVTITDNGSEHGHIEIEGITNDACATAFAMPALDYTGVSMSAENLRLSNAARNDHGGLVVWPTENRGNR